MLALMPEAYLGWSDQLQPKTLLTWLRDAHLLPNIQVLERHRRLGLHTIVRELWNMYSAEKQQSLIVFDDIMDGVIKARSGRG